MDHFLLFSNNDLKSELNAFDKNIFYDNNYLGLDKSSEVKK